MGAIVTSRVGERIFDKYEIQERLAVGGMGEVFYALQKSGAVAGFERAVILKNLLPDLAAQPKFVEQFLDEARVAAKLNHPNVVSLYEVGAWNGQYFIAMEFISGRNLSQLMKEARDSGRPVPLNVAARIAHDAALGLDHAHRARDAEGRALSIVHRDVSPQNILVSYGGEVKVTPAATTSRSNATPLSWSGYSPHCFGPVNCIAP